MFTSPKLEPSSARKSPFVLSSSRAQLGNSKLVWARAEPSSDFDFVSELSQPSLSFLAQASSSSSQLGTLWNLSTSQRVWRITPKLKVPKNMNLNLIYIIKLRVSKQIKIDKKNPTNTQVEWNSTESSIAKGLGTRKRLYLNLMDYDSELFCSIIV